VRDAERLARLAVLADLMREAALARLSHANAAREESLARLAALDAPVSQEGGIDPVAFAAAGVRYQAWATARRVKINGDLAMQTATVLREREAARGAIGRAQVLDKLRGR